MEHATARRTFAFRRDKTALSELSDRPFHRTAARPRQRDELVDGPVPGATLAGQMIDVHVDAEIGERDVGLLDERHRHDGPR